jgi:hypothetical protein
LKNQSADWFGKELPEETCLKMPEQPCEGSENFLEVQAEIRAGDKRMSTIM